MGGFVVNKSVGASGTTDEVAAEAYSSRSFLGNFSQCFGSSVCENDLFGFRFGILNGDKFLACLFCTILGVFFCGVVRTCVVL